MTGKPNINTVIVCATVIVCLVIAGIVGIDMAGRSVPNFLSSLFGFLAAALPAVGAYLKATNTGTKVDAAATVIDDIQSKVNGHLDAHEQQTAALATELAKVDPTNTVLKDMTASAVDNPQGAGNVSS